jgi:hypothetical protein
MSKRAVVATVLACLFLAATVGIAEASWFERGKRVRGSGDVVEVDRDVEGITGVELATIGTLYIEVGDEEALSLEGEDNLLEYIETDVHGGTLVIDTEEGVSLRPRKQLRYYLTVKSLEEIEISSSGDIEAGDFDAEDFSIDISSSGDLEIGTLNCTDLEIDMSSSGDVYIDELHAETLEADLSSSGDLEIGGGEVESQEISLSSSGDYNARDLASNDAEIDVTSSGDATVRVRDFLEATTSSSGDVYYYGNPEVDSSEESSGDVKRVGK